MKRKLTPLAGLALVLFGLAQAAHALTLTDILAQVRRNVRDTATSTTLQRYSDAVLTTIINEGQRDVVNNTWILSSSSTVTSSVGQADYDLPTDCIEPWRVSRAAMVLPEVSMYQLDTDNPGNWQTEDGPVTAWYRNKATSGKFSLYPYPSTAGEAVAVSVYCYSTAPDLSAGSDVPFKGEARFTSYHDLLAWYASYRILFIEGVTDKASQFKQQYETRIGVLLMNYGAKPTREAPVPAGGSAQ